MILFSNSQICVHSDNKQYAMAEAQESDFSAVNIGNHKLKDNILALNNKTWDENETVYWQLDSDYEWISDEVLADICKDAFLETSLTTKLRINQKRRQTGDAHIKIQYLGKKDEKYFKREGVLAFAYGPQQGIGGDITMNADMIWWLPSWGKLQSKMPMILE